MSDLLTRWRALLEQPRAAQHLAQPGHPLSIYIGRTSAGRPELLVASPTRPAGLELGSAFTLDTNYRSTTGDWLLVISVADHDLSGTFMSLAEDLILRSGEGTDATRAMNILMEALSDWRRLLRRGAALSDEELRGLIAELWYGFDYLSRRFSSDLVVAAWQPSPTAAQDFHFPRNERHEVKAIRPGAKTVTVSSAEQLDPSDGDVLLVTVELTDAAETEGVTLNTLVEALEAKLSNAARSRLRDTLACRGWDPRADYSHVRVVPSMVVTYAVDESFPSLRVDNVPNGVVSLQYALSLAELRGHRTDVEDGPTWN